MRKFSKRNNLNPISHGALRVIYRRKSHLVYTSLSAQQLFYPALTYTEIFGLRVVDNNCRSGLLGNELVRGGQAHAQVAFSRQQVKHFTVILQLRNSRVAPGVAFALFLSKTQLAADV